MRVKNERRLLKKIGRLFVHLEQQETGIMNFRAIVVDNGYSPFNHLVSCLNNLRGSLNNVNITILTMPHRMEFIKKTCGDLSIINAHRKYIPRRFRPAFELILLKRRRPDLIVLLTPDVLTVLASIIFVRKRLYIYMPQHKWCLLRRKTVDEFLLLIPRLLFNLLVFIYLLFAAMFIFLRRPLITKRKSI